MGNLALPRVTSSAGERGRTEDEVSDAQGFFAMNECSRSTCFVPDTGCDLGHTNLTECPAWTGKAEIPANMAGAEEGLLPWSGSALGLSDLGFLAGRSRPFVVGIAGPQSAGKTTLLGAWYLLVGRGALASSDRKFAGSHSLSGWEAVASSLRWSPGQPPTFPPHTTSRGGRAPGLLHLSFRETDGLRLKDFLFTDAPGEWFQKWALNRESDEAAGARWVADRADILLLVADREALAGESMGAARNSIQLLAQRLAGERRNRPVALVWTKSDVEISREMETAVRKAVMDTMPDAKEFAVSIVSPRDDSQAVGRGLIELLEWTLAIRRGKAELPASFRTTADPLFLFGARS
jgi:hypothetical protein